MISSQHLLRLQYEMNFFVLLKKVYILLWKNFIIKVSTRLMLNVYVTRWTEAALGDVRPGGCHPYCIIHRPRHPQS